MKTYQVCKHVSYEYFVEAESLEEAQEKISNDKIKHESEEVFGFVLIDVHDGNDWINEPTGEGK